jgi:hypothetical protein
MMKKRKYRRKLGNGAEEINGEDGRENEEGTRTRGRKRNDTKIQLLSICPLNTCNDPGDMDPKGLNE